MNPKTIKNRKKVEYHKQLNLFRDTVSDVRTPDASDINLKSFCRETIQMSSTLASFDLAVAVLTEAKK